MDEEEVVKCWKSSASLFGCSWNFLNDSSTLRSRWCIFDNVLISLEKLIESSHKFYHRCVLGPWGSPHYTFLKLLPAIWSPETGRESPWRRSAFPSGLVWPQDYVWKVIIGQPVASLVCICNRSLYSTSAMSQMHPLQLQRMNVSISALMLCCSAVQTCVQCERVIVCFTLIFCIWIYTRECALYCRWDVRVCYELKVYKVASVISFASYIRLTLHCLNDISGHVYRRLFLLQWPTAR